MDCIEVTWASFAILVGGIVIGDLVLAGVKSWWGASN